MAIPKSLMDLCLDGIKDYAKTNAGYVSKSGREDRLLSTLHGVINILKSRLIPGQRSENPSPQNELEQNLLSQATGKSQTTEKKLSTRETQTDSSYEKLVLENLRLKKSAERVEEQRKSLQIVVDELTNDAKKMAEIIKEKELEMSETLLELGRVSVELTRVENEKKRNELFKKTYKSQTSTQTSEILEVFAMAPGAGLPSWSSETTSATMENGSYLVGHGSSFPISIQESLCETKSLTDIPATSGVERNIYNNYKLLLLKIGSSLLEGDVDKLKHWLENEFQIHAARDIHTIFQELDRKKVINITDLSRLKKFFEDNFRFDLVHLIDSYLLGEYEDLKHFKTTAKL